MPEYHIYTFGVFTLNTREKQLLKDGQPVPLMLKGYEVLALLVKLHGHLVEKDQILKEVWPERFVEESNIAQNIHHLRKALGEGEKGREFIETVPGRGYRFVAEVHEIANEERPELIDVTSAQLPAHPGVEPQTTNSIQSPSQPRRFRTIHLVAVLLILAGVVALTWTLSSRKAPDSHPLYKSLAVLPFKPLGTESKDELLGLGMADALITKLSNYSDMPVLPTSSVFKFVDREHDPVDTGRELNVEAVLSGTVQRSGEKVRVTVQLIDVKTRHSIWAGTFDEQFTNIFALQDRISDQIVRALDLTVKGSTQAGHSTKNVEAYQSYLMGLYFWNKRSKENLYKSTVYLQEALTRDSNYGLAHALQADAYALIGLYRYPPMSSTEAFEKSKASANTALKLDDGLAMAHLALAIVKSNERDPAGVEQSLVKAVKLQPTNATAHQRYAWHLAGKGRLQEAVSEMRRAQALDPLSAVINSALASLLLNTRDYDDALRYTQKAVEIEPASYDGHLTMSEAYELKGMYKESLAALEKATSIDPANTYTLSEKGRVYALSGQPEKAREVLATLEKSNDSHHYGIALIYLALKQKPEAFIWLDRAVEKRSVNSIQLRFDPKLDPLRADPQYAEILRRHNLERLLS